MRCYFETGLATFFVSAIIGGIIYLLCCLLIKQLRADVKSRRMLRFICIWYLAFLTMAVFGTFATRSFSPEQSIYNLVPFSSYKQSYVYFDLGAMLTIALNFALFVPFGFLFCKLTEGKSVHKFIPLLGLALSLAAESMQYVTHRGIADIDDLITNTIGVIWGCCLYYNITRRGQKGTWLRKLSLSLPLVFVLAVFSIYAFKPYGNLECEFYSNGIKRSVMTELDMTAIDVPELVNIYKLQQVDIKEAEKAANMIFAALGEEKDTQLNYETCIVCHSMKRSYELWYYLDSGCFDLKNYKGPALEFDSTKTMEDRLRELLDEMGVSVPENAAFSQKSDGEYTFCAELLAENEAIYDGQMNIRVFDNSIQEIENNIQKMQLYKSEPSIRAEEIALRLNEGRYFVAADSSEMLAEILREPLAARKIKLTYIMDTKGFYRPVYELAGTDDECSAKILIPAC